MSLHQGGVETWVLARSNGFLSAILGYLGYHLQPGCRNRFETTELASAGELDSKVDDVDLLDVRQKPKFFAPKLEETVWERSVPGKVHINQGMWCQTTVHHRSVALFITEVEAFQHSPCFYRQNPLCSSGPLKVQYIPISEASYLVDQVFHLT